MAIKVEQDITINRPVSDVFAYLTQPKNLPEWQESVQEVHLHGDGPIKVGSRWTEKRMVMNRPMDGDIEVTELELDRRFTIKSVAGPVTMSVDHVLSPAGEGTLMRIVGEGELGGPMKLAGRMVQREIRKVFEADLARLKRRLEST
jgi:uncharacterized membrane protein